MGWFQDLQNGVGAVANAIADGAETVVDAVEEVASDVFETAGNAVEDGLEVVGAAVGGVPIIGRAAHALLGWVGYSLSAAIDVLAAIVKGAGGLIRGTFAGLVRLLGGIVSLNPRLMLRGLGNIGAGVAGVLVIVGGKVVSVVQTIFFLERPRALNPKEQELLHLVFRRSLAIYNIRIVDGFAGVFSINGRAFTLGNTIYLKGFPVDTLVHEAVHTWQFRHAGAGYAPEALFAQWTLPDAYDWLAEIARGRGDWTEFNRESQAQLMQNLYNDGERSIPLPARYGGGAFFEIDPVISNGQPVVSGAFSFVFGGVDHTALAIRAVAELRRKRSFRFSQFLV